MFSPEGVVSDSEEEKGPEAVAQQNTTSAWSSKHKQSNEQGGYSSEASSERGESEHVQLEHKLMRYNRKRENRDQADSHDLKVHIYYYNLQNDLQPN